MFILKSIKCKTGVKHKFFSLISNKKHSAQSHCIYPITTNAFENEKHEKLLYFILFSPRFVVYDWIKTTTKTTKIKLHRFHSTKCYTFSNFQLKFYIIKYKSIIIYYNTLCCIRNVNAEIVAKCNIKNCNLKKRKKENRKKITKQQQQTA